MNRRTNTWRGVIQERSGVKLSAVIRRSGVRSLGCVPYREPDKSELTLIAQSCGAVLADSIKREELRRSGASEFLRVPESVATRRAIAEARRRLRKRTR